MGNLPPKITKENYYPKNTPKNKILQWTKSVVYMLVSSFLISFAAYSLIAPNTFTIGGASGVAILINIATKGAIQQSTILFCINLPLIILAFLFVKRKFAILSTVNIIMQSVWLVLLEVLFPGFKIQFLQHSEKIFAALAGGICIGVAVALAFKAGGSTGGADILAVMIQRKIPANSIAWMLFIINCTVIGASLLVFYDKEVAIAYNVLPIMLSVFESFVESKMNESITNGFQSAIEFRIITDKPEEMASALMHELSRGVTLMPVKGMYTQKEKGMLLCLVNRRQVVALKKIMKEIDKDAFAVMSNATQVLGLGFYTPEN